MSIWTATVSFAVVAGLLTLVPGVDTALLLRSAAAHGTRAGVATALGVATGLLTWGMAAAGGLAVLLTASEVAYSALRIAGGIYLVWLGVTSLLAARQSGGTGQVEATAATGSMVRAWARGVTTNLLNPKVGVFYLAMLPQFIPPQTSHLLMGFALTMIHVIEGLAWSAVLIYAVRFARSWLGRPSVKRAMEGITGSVLLAFGVKLALDTP